LSFAVDRYVSARQTAMLSARAVAYQPKPDVRHDAIMLMYCALIAVLMLAMLGMAVFASFANFWPYDLSPSLRHYTLGLVDGEVGEGFINSLKMASGTAFFGTQLVIVTAYLLEKTTHGCAWFGFGLGLYLFLQHAQQPPARHVPKHGLADALHHRSLLHHGTPHGHHCFEIFGCRI
jgi:ABC-type Fe3+ transport system permease subunit